MILTNEQQVKVEENLGLVNRVINDKVHGLSKMGIYSRDDLYQIGCIGLCKAAATDKGGNFSTYAYRLIWNQICDALIYATRRKAVEIYCDVIPYICEPIGEMSELKLDVDQAIQTAKSSAPPSTAKGIDALVLMAKGYTCREIGKKMNASDKLVSAWMSKAKTFLRARPEIQNLMKAYVL